MISMRRRKIVLSFNRDFNQWINELVRYQHVFNFPKVLGVGLSDQITHFDGRTFEWWRYEDEMSRFKEHVTNQSPSASIFSSAAIKKFLRLVRQLRKLSTVAPRKIKSPWVHINQLEALFNVAYPWYPLSIFISGPWRDDLARIHGVKARLVIDRFTNSRKLSKGLPNIVGDHLRQWLGHYLEAVGLPGDSVKLLSVKEVRNLVRYQKLPALKILQARASGFVYYRGHIYPTKHFKKFLAAHKLTIASSAVSTRVSRLTGAVAMSVKHKIVGKVQVVFNTVEANNFSPGAILVTPMTIPTFMPAVRSAKAIITDEGGLLCHASIISRELKIPCIIGTKIATQVFKDGDMVEVDAEKGMVRKLG